MCMWVENEASLLTRLSVGVMAFQTQWSLCSTPLVHFLLFSALTSHICEGKNGLFLFHTSQVPRGMTDMDWCLGGQGLSA